MIFLSQDLKLRVIEICLIVLITIIIIPYSGWTKTAAQSNAPIPSIKWSTVFRNASGVLRNVSSAGPEARRVMRDCEGLVDSFVWIIKAPIGKNDIDNKVYCEDNERSPFQWKNRSFLLDNIRCWSHYTAISIDHIHIFGIELELVTLGTEYSRLSSLPTPEGRFAREVGREAAVFAGDKDQRFFLARSGISFRPKAEPRAANKVLTETGNRARKVSGTQGRN